MSDRVVATTRYLNLIDRNHWYFATRPNAGGVVAIVAVTAQDELLLVEQFRPPLQVNVIELPAGLAGDVPGQMDESLACAARRELEEETGYRCGRLRHLMNAPSSAGLTDEMVSLFLAEDLERTGTGGGDEHESITVHHVPIADIQAWMDAKTQDGCLLDFKIMAGLWFWQRTRAT